MNWKRIVLWAGVVFVWLITIGCWFLSVYLGRGYQEWSQWWAGDAWAIVDLLLCITALIVTATAAIIDESSK